MAGPLTGYRVIEIAGIGPGPFCAMMLADMGADVIRVDRAQNVREGVDTSKPPIDLLARGRRSIAVDLKQADGVETLLKMVESADALIEGFGRASWNGSAPGRTSAWRATPSSCSAA